ncbi:MAG: helix-turn-helix domain-containing protein [Parasphingorhabdus sp.]
MSSLNSAPVTLRFFIPDERLRPYISTYYLTEVNPATEERITDWLHPEWANLRIIEGILPMGSIGNEDPITAPRFSVVGPTSCATYFESNRMRSWGIGLLPLGWSKFIGVSAADYSDKTTDGNIDPHFAKFAPLTGGIFGAGTADPEKEVQFIEEFFLNLLEGADADDLLIQKAHQILIDESLATVQDMADLLGVTGRTLDRLSRRAFGFPPKLLLRRQRFLRSLAENMLNPSQNWISTLDQHYYDQAHFGRDFQRFMGMSASEYKAKPHPFLNAAVHGRMAAAGAGMQVLHDPKTGN